MEIKFTLEEVKALGDYLGRRPFVEAEPYVQLLRKKVQEAEAASKPEEKKELKAVESK